MRGNTTNEPRGITRNVDRFTAMSIRDGRFVWWCGLDYGHIVEVQTVRRAAPYKASCKDYQISDLLWWREVSTQERGRALADSLGDAVNWGVLTDAGKPTFKQPWMTT